MLMKFMFSKLFSHLCCFGLLSFYHVIFEISPDFTCKVTNNDHLIGKRNLLYECKTKSLVRQQVNVFQFTPHHVSLNFKSHSALIQQSVISQIFD